MFKKYTREQLLVLLGACLFQCAMIGVLVNCSGVLFAQIRQELGFSLSKVSAYNTIKSVTGAVAAASVTGLFFKTNKTRFLLINQLMALFSFVLIIFGAEGWLWYAAAVINGLSMCVSSVAVPSMLNQWFPKNAGTATGIAMAFSGIGGAICNPICAKLILIIGWKTTILVLGAIMLLLTIPGLYLMFHWQPAEAPLHPSQKKTNTTSAKPEKKTGIFLLLCLVLLAGGVGVQFAMNMSVYAQNIGYTLTVGASMTTMIMIGNVASKFIYGFLCDSLGVWKSTGLGFLCVGTAVLCFILFCNQLAILYVAALIYGFVYALSMISVSRCCIAAYGEQDYKHFLGIHTSINNGVMALSSLLVGILFDKTQSFTPVLLMILSVTVLSFAALTILSYSLRKKS